MLDIRFETESSLLWLGESVDYVLSKRLALIISTWFTHKYWLIDFLVFFTTCWRTKSVNIWFNFLQNYTWEKNLDNLLTNSWFPAWKWYKMRFFTKNKHTKCIFNFNTTFWNIVSAFIMDVFGSKKCSVLNSAFKYRLNNIVDTILKNVPCKQMKRKLYCQWSYKLWKCWYLLFTYFSWYFMANKNEALRRVIFLWFLFFVWYV